MHFKYNLNANLLFFKSKQKVYIEYSLSLSTTVSFLPQKLKQENKDIFKTFIDFD